MKFSHFMPPTHSTVLASDEFCKQIEKRTDGKVKITFYPGGSLLSAAAMPEGVETGISDMGFISPSQAAGRFPVLGAISVSVGFPSGFVASHVHDDFIAKFQPKEMASYHVLAASATGPMAIWTKSKPVRKLEDISNMKIRDIGVSADRLKLLGATTIGLTAAEVYDALSKGIIDGCSFPIAEGLGWRVAEVAKYATRYWQVTSSGHFVAVMDVDKWNTLSPDIQAAFNELIPAYADNLAKAWNSLDNDGAKFSKDKGVEFIDLTPEEITKFEKAIVPLKEQFTKDILGRGFSKDDVTNWFNYIASRTDYWLKKQIELGIKSPIGPKEILQ